MAWPIDECVLLQNCAEGEECDAAAADAAEGNPCRLKS